MIKKIFYLAMMFGLLFMLSACIPESNENEVKVTSIQVDTTTLLEDYDYDEFDIEVIKIIIHKSDDSQQTMPVTESMLSEDDISKLAVPGSHLITVTYENVTTTFTVELKDLDLENQLTHYYQLGISQETISGTYGEWLETISNQGGERITELSVNTTGHLIVTYANDANYDAGQFITLENVSLYDAYINSHPEYGKTMDEFTDEILNGDLSNQQYTVTLKLIGGQLAGDESNTFTVDLGTVIDLPQPTRIGYIFDGWYFDEDTTTEVSNEALLVVDNYDLYAKWHENQIPVLVNVKPHQTYYIGYGDYDPIVDVYANDDEDGIISEISLIGEYDLAVEGTYTLTVRAEDSEGATGEETIILDVMFSPVPDVLTNQPIEITIMHAFGEQKANLIKEYIAEFNQLYPNITITLLQQPSYDTLNSNLSSAIVARTEPTMIIGYPDYVPNYLNADVIEPLDAYAIHPEWGNQLDDFIKAYINENTSYDNEGILYGLPFNKTTEVFVYNKTFFDNQAFTFPSNLTWDDIETASELVKSEYSSIDVYGFAYNSASNMFITLTKQWGGQYASLGSNGNGVLEFNNEEAKTMINYFMDLQSRGLATLPQTWEVDYTNTPFLNQQVFMSVFPLSAISYMIPSENEFELGILPIPQYDVNNQYVMETGSNISIMKHAGIQEKLAAWLFMKFLTSTEITADWAIETGYLPVRESAYQTSEYQAYLNYNPDLNGLTGNALEDALGKKYTAMAAKVAYDQRNVMFHDQPFNGSEDVRQQVDSMLINILVNHVNINEAIAGITYN